VILGRKRSVPSAGSQLPPMARIGDKFGWRPATPNRDGGRSASVPPAFRGAQLPRVVAGLNSSTLCLSDAPHLASWKSHAGVPAFGRLFCDCPRGPCSAGGGRIGSPLPCARARPIGASQDTAPAPRSVARRSPVGWQDPRFSPSPGGLGPMDLLQARQGSLIPERRQRSCSWLDGSRLPQGQHLALLEAAPIPRHT